MESKGLSGCGPLLEISGADHVARSQEWLRYPEDELRCWSRARSRSSEGTSCQRATRASRAGPYSKTIWCHGFS